MLINLEFTSLAELDEFVAHHTKNKAVQAIRSTAAETPKAETVKAETPKEEAKKEPKAEKPKEPVKAETPKAEAEGELEFSKDVAPRILKLAEKKGRDAAVALLKSFGVDKGPQLEAGQYAKFVKAADAKLAEED